MTQDLDTVWAEWTLEVEHPDPAAFVEHLVAWGLIDAATGTQALRLLEVPLAGALDDDSEEIEDDVATMHYASWTETGDTTEDPDRETRLANPLLKWDDTSEELLSEGAPLPEPEPPPEDPTGRFRFLDPHRAEDRALGRLVAYGELHREARLLAQLEHPGIAPIYELVDEDRVTRRVVAGATLREQLDERRARHDLLDAVIRVAETVAYAHARGVAHGHLGPEVVHVGELGEVLVTGWGEARVFDRSVARPVALDDGTGRLERPGDDLRALGRMLLEVAGAAGPPELRAIAEGAVRYDSAAALLSDLKRARAGEAVQIAPDSAIRAAARAIAHHPERALWALVALGLATAASLAAALLSSL